MESKSEEDARKVAELEAELRRVKERLSDCQVCQACDHRGEIKAF